MHHGDAEMTHGQKSKPKVCSRGVINQMSELGAMMLRPTIAAVKLQIFILSLKAYAELT